MEKLIKYFVVVLVLALLVSGFVVITLPDEKLHVIACDVGQGDSILITYESIQILTDGGPKNGRLNKCLNDNIPFWDREIELVILTHPQLDHFGGLIDVFQDYKVINLLANSIDSGSDSYQLLKDLVGSNGVNVIDPTSTEKLRLSLISLDILNPTDETYTEKNVQEVISLSKNILGAHTTKSDLNDFSISYLLSFKSFKAVFTGDLGPEKLKKISGSGSNIRADLLKVPHHGSKNGLVNEFLDAVDPSVSFISAGKANRYGHPDQLILDMLSNKGVQVFRTDLIGSVELITDGIGDMSVNGRTIMLKEDIGLQD